MRCIVLCCLPLQATTCEGMLKVAKMKYKLHVASCLNLPWYGSMEWNMEENFGTEWNMERKIFSMDGNGMEENFQYGIWKNLLPFHTMPCL